MWPGRGGGVPDPRRPGSAGSSVGSNSGGGAGGIPNSPMVPPHSPQDLAASALAAYTLDASANAAAFASAYDNGAGPGGFGASPGGAGGAYGAQPTAAGGAADQGAAAYMRQRAALQRELHAQQQGGTPGGAPAGVPNLQEQSRLRAEMEMLAAMRAQRQQQVQQAHHSHQQAELQELQRRRELEQAEYLRRAQAERRAREMAEAERGRVRAAEAAAREEAERRAALAARAQAEQRAREEAEEAERLARQRRAQAEARAQAKARAQAEAEAQAAAIREEAEREAAAAKAARDAERKAKRAADQRARRQRIKEQREAEMRRAQAEADAARAEAELRSQSQQQNHFGHAAAFQDDEEAERSAFEAMGMGDDGGHDHAGAFAPFEDEEAPPPRNQQHRGGGDAKVPVSPMVRQQSAGSHSSSGLGHHQHHQQRHHLQHQHRHAPQHQQQRPMHRQHSLDDGLFDDPYSPERDGRGEAAAVAAPFPPAAEKVFPGSALDGVDEDMEESPEGLRHPLQDAVNRESAPGTGGGEEVGGGIIPRGYVGPDSDSEDDVPTAAPPPPPQPKPKPPTKPKAKAKPKKKKEPAPKKDKPPVKAKANAKVKPKPKPKKKVQQPAPLALQPPAPPAPQPPAPPAPQPPAQQVFNGYPPVAEKTFPQLPVEPTEDEGMGDAERPPPAVAANPVARPPPPRPPAPATLTKKKTNNSAKKKTEPTERGKKKADLEKKAVAVVKKKKKESAVVAAAMAAAKKRQENGAATAAAIAAVAAAKKKKESSAVLAAKKKSPSSAKKSPASQSPVVAYLAKKDVAKKDSVKKETAKKDLAKKELAKKDSTKKDSTKKESAKKDTTKKILAKKETAKKETAKKETAKKETATKATAKKETAKKETAKKETAKKEMAKKETAKKETAKKETAKKKASSTPTSSSSTPSSSTSKKSTSTPSSAKSTKLSKLASSAGTTTPAKKKGGSGSIGGGKSPASVASTPGGKGSVSSSSSIADSEERVTPAKGKMPTLEDEVPEITDVEYRNLEQLMDVFCRVPLLAEFSRPVSLLHPELVPVYSKVVKHPMDLGRVCRNIRRRLYPNTRAVRLEMWRIFANCVKFHTHPQTRDGAVHSFVSIALHLREYFNYLWQEYMLPSDHPGPGSLPQTKGTHVNPTMEQYRKSFDQRDKDRKARMTAISTTILSNKCLEKTANAIERFVESGGRVDELDVDPILETEDDDDYDAVMQALLRLKSRLAELSNSNQEFTVGELGREVRGCYAGEDDVLEDRPSLRNRFAARLDRLVGKVIVPIYETGCRGVNQSSVWGCMAAAIWSRESAKRPYWPAIVLGILAPEDQSEEWHKALTERNEARLPEKLQHELQAGKRKAEQALRRQSTGKAERMSFFLVEFLGTHEFIWVREADIIENFDPDDDPNENIAAGNITKKRKGARSHGQTPHSARLMQNAIEEGRWAMEEFEMQLNDTCGDLSDDEGDGGGADDNYSFEILCESDDEADEEGSDEDNSEAEALAIEEEITELLSTEGLLDFSVTGRKKAKQRAAALKKQREEARKAAKKKQVAEKAKKKADMEKRAKAEVKKKKAQEKKVERERMTEYKKELKELEKRRKKRARDRDRVLKEEERKAKKFKAATSPSKGGRRPGIPDKKGRAAAIVQGYLSRLSERDDLKGLGLSSVMNIPAATIETTGLLGMTLAFRAAAGDIDMPGSGGSENKAKPWENINTTKHNASEDRCKALEKKIELLEGAIKNISNKNERKRSLLKQAEEETEAKKRSLANAEKRARKNPLGQRKKPPKKPDSAVKNRPDESSEKEPNSCLDDKGENEKVMKDSDRSDKAEDASSVATTEGMDSASAQVTLGDEEMHEVESHASGDHDDDSKSYLDTQFSDADEDS